MLFYKVKGIPIGITSLLKILYFSKFRFNSYSVVAIFFTSYSLYS